MYGQLISSVTVGSGGASTIDFTSIPGTFTDLVLVISSRSTVSGNGDNMGVRFNSDTGSNYSWKILYGNAGTAYGWGSSSSTSMYVFAHGGSLDSSSTFGNTIITVPNYTGSTAKPISWDGGNENNANNTSLGIGAGLWSGTSAITSISIRATSGSNLVQYSTAYLYGLTKGSGGATVS